MALNCLILDCDSHDWVDERIGKISSLRNAVNGLIYTIEKTGDYYPADLEAIYELMIEILNSEKSFLIMMEKEVLKKRKILKAQVKSTVNERLDKLCECKKAKK